MTLEDVDDRLKTAPEHLVRTILRTICHDDYSVKRKTSEYLDKFDARLSATTSAGAKRKASDTGITLCVNCEIPFTDAENSDTACVHHPGEMYWDDSEGEFDVYDGDPDPDTDENRKEFPQAFKWDCCGEKGDGKKGCVQTRHEGVDSKRQREK